MPLPLVPSSRAVRVRSVLLATIALIAFAPAAAHAAAGFVSQPSVGGAAQVSEVHAAMNSKGDLVMVWLQGPAGGPQRVAAAMRPPGGSFGPVQLIDDPAQAGAQTPRVGIDAAGDAFAIWVAVLQTGGRSVVVASAPAGQQFGAPQVLDSTNTPTQPAIAVSPAGSVLTAWTFSSTFVGARGNVTRAGQSISAANTITLADGTNQTVTGGPAVAFGPNGNGAVVYPRAPNGSGPRTINISTVAPGSGTLVSENAFNSATTTMTNTTLDAAVDGQGRTIAVWKDNATSGGGIAWAVRPAGGNGFDATAHLLAGPTATQPQVAMDSAGDAVAVWNGSDHIRAAFRPAAAATIAEFGSPQVIDSTGGSFANPVARMDPSTGRAVAAWDEGSAVHGTSAPLNGAFGLEQVLTAPGSTSNHASVTVGGDGAVAWTDIPASGNQAVGVAGFDDEPPSLTSTSVPATGDVGVPVAFSAMTFDVWGPTAVNWSFGDGGIGTGPTLTHTYAQAGDYSVTPSVSDSVLNIVPGSPAVIHITGPAGPPPLPPPVLGATFNVAPVSGRVLVSTPKPKAGSKAARAERALVHVAASIPPPRGYTAFHLVKTAETLPVGAVFDTSKGVVALTMSANKSNTQTQTGQLSKGAFKTSQDHKKPLTTFTPMGGGNFNRDCRASGVRAARRAPTRQLFANVHGHFRTRGRHSTATVSGTEYLVKDSCRGTLTEVRRGTVRVLDLVKHRTVAVKAGHRYLAQPKPLRKRR